MSIADGMLDQVVKLLAPMLADYAAGKLPVPAKRLLYLNLVALTAEARRAVAKTAGGVDDALLEAILKEAEEEFDAVGLPGLVETLDGLVEF